MQGTYYMLEWNVGNLLLLCMLHRVALYRFELR